ncbi:MAG TPA: hypothetical protein P5274_03090 [Candidatus Paceibacterota bacterium]|nr:hypothetical protein [Candidatus Paceibacterota bacterium]
MLKNYLSFNLPVLVIKQNKRFVAYTPALDLSTSGKSEKEAKQRFEEVASIFFEEIIEAGTIKEVLSELGWKKTQKKWFPPQVVSSRSVGLRVPCLA